MFTSFAFKSITGNTPLELVKQVKVFRSKAHTIYIFPTLLRPIFRFFLRSKKNKQQIFRPKCCCLSKTKSRQVLNLFIFKELDKLPSENEGC